MICDRYGCDNIMCDTYISGIGHICDDCKAEFKREFASYVSMDIQVETLLKQFMHTEPVSSRDGEAIIDEYFNEYTNNL